MKLSDIENAYQDSLYTSVNSDPPKDRLDVFYESVKELAAVDDQVDQYLLDRDAKLTALENAGVDNWEGYEEAMRAE